MMGKKKTAMKRGGSVNKVAKKRGGGMVKKKAKGGAINQHKRMAMGLMGGGMVKKRAKGSGRTGEQMYSRGYLQSSGRSSADIALEKKELKNN